jgi:hypothetical protein
MYVITTALYPNDKAKEVVNMQAKAMAKYPPDVSLGTMIVPAAVVATLKGIKVITIIEVKKGKLEDALASGAIRLAMFHDIQGYRYTMKTYMNLEEAMKTIGM